MTSSDTAGPAPPRGARPVSTPAVDEASDRRLVVAHQTGRGDGFSELYGRHYGRLVRWCRRQVRDVFVAEDIAQEAFTRAYANLHRLQGDRRFYAWLTVIARRLIANHYRRQRLAVRHSNATTRSVLHEWDSDPAILTLDRLATEQVITALKLLPAHQQRLLRLREWDGLSYAEIADTLGVAVTVVRPQLHRARVAFGRKYRAIASHGRLTGMAGPSIVIRFLDRLKLRFGRVNQTVSAFGEVGAPVVAAMVIGVAALSSSAAPAAVSPRPSSIHDASSRAHVLPALERAAPGLGSTRVADPMSTAPAQSPGTRLIVAQGVASDERAGSFRDGLASVGHGEQEFESDRDRARRMPHYFEAGPWYWGFDPAQARRETQHITEGLGQR